MRQVLLNHFLPLRPRMLGVAGVKEEYSTPTERMNGKPRRAFCVKNHPARMYPEVEDASARFPRAILGVATIPPAERTILQSEEPRLELAEPKKRGALLQQEPIEGVGDPSSSSELVEGGSIESQTSDCRLGLYELEWRDRSTIASPIASVHAPGVH
eukprot:CAMPEP_0117522350 /NCGR_PEP_ID=MMETSP0784-20121206/34162_1 /TAXON_ID=39447 /ORGANISM="" /LENGTH=156 /DNA_ID=CAMNT_0005318419 /DNA_START=90 /DNA_END=558 /DNA_ORIENTATION=-